MSTLILSASKHGSTTDIAARIAETLSTQGVQVTVGALDDANLVSADCVVIGLPVYTQKLLASGVDFLTEHQDELDSREVFIFVSGGSPHLDAKLRAQLQQYTAHQVQYFRGAVDSSKLNLAEKAVLKVVKSPLDADWRDWDAIDQWAVSIAASEPGEAGTGNIDS